MRRLRAHRKPRSGESHEEPDLGDDVDIHSPAGFRDEAVSDVEAGTLNMIVDHIGFTDVYGIRFADTQTIEFRESDDVATEWLETQGLI